MRRRLSAVVLGLLATLVIAAPVFADTVPGPGNFRDSGTSDYVNAFASECGQTTCTDTFVYGSIVDLQGGETFAYVCIDQFTYSIRGGGRFQSLSGCAEGTAPDIASDLSSATIDATILADSCGRRTCSTVEVSLSLSLAAIGDPNSYSYTQKNEYQNCVDTYRVKGEAADAEGTLVINGSSLAAYGQIGSESWAFSTRCH
jgi:hypothetical protein